MIKTGDKIIIIKGKDRGKTGVVSGVDLVKKRIKVEGLNLVKRHLRKTTRGGGGIVQVPASMSIANVMLADPATGKPTRIGHKDINGKKMRITKKSNTVIEDAKK